MYTSREAPIAILWADSATLPDVRGCVHMAACTCLRARVLHKAGAFDRLKIGIFLSDWTVTSRGRGRD